MAITSESSSASFTEQEPISVICKDALLCQCLMLCIGYRGHFDRVIGFKDSEEWLVSETYTSDIVIFWVSDALSLDKLLEIDLDILRKKSPKITVIVISVLNNAYSIVNALSKGIRGYVTADSDLDILLGAVRLVQAGGIYAPSNSLRKLASAGVLREKHSYGRPKKDISTFTDREMTILCLLRLGDSNKRIARELNLSEGTIKLHVRSIMQKTGAKNRTHIAYLTNNIFE